MAVYQYKGAEVGIVQKLAGMDDAAALDAGLNYMTQGALSPDGFRRFQGERLAAARSSGGGSNGKLTCKVGRSGGVSVYGLQRMPVTLYAEQWKRLLNGAPADHFVLAFIASDPSTNWPADGDKPACVAKLASKADKAALAV